MGLQFPEVYLTSYVAGSLPRIKAKDLNALQKEQIRTWRALRGSDILIADEFSGDTQDRGTWVNQTNNPTIEDDSANGAAGIAKLDPSATSNRIMRTQSLVLGTQPFRLSVRVKATLTGSSSIANIGIGLMKTGSPDIGVFLWMGKKPNAALTNKDRISAYLSNTGGGTYLDMDGGVSRDSNYHVLELIRTSSAIQLVYDGVILVESTSATWVSKNFTAPMELSIITDDGDGTKTNYYVLRVDAIKFWTQRSTLTEAVGGSPPAQHYEEQTAAVAAASSVVVTWSQAFADTSYKIKLGFYRSDSSTPVAYAVTAKLTTSVTVTFASAVTGELYIEAHD